jgi:aminodeoxyfutalosine deaminase
MKILTADFVVTIESGVIPGGAVAVDGDSIAAVGTAAKLESKFPNAEKRSFGQAAIIPGLINAHSHLEITLMRGFLDDVEDDFYSWLMKLTSTRARLSVEGLQISAMLGAAEGARAGVTCFGDIGRYGLAGFQALKHTGLRGTVFQETEFSPKNERAPADFALLEERFLELREIETGLVKAGISPHAPYTVSPALFGAIARFANDKSIPLSIHAAESTAEQNLMLYGTGLFADVFQNKLGLDLPTPFKTPIDFLDATGILECSPLLAHCVYATDSDLDLIAQKGVKIAHCPKSNAKFGHGVAPLEKFLDRKIAVGLGSDSVASNNMCDLLEEGRFAALAARTRTGRKRFLTAREILETSTLGGAKALGLEKTIGTLEPGKKADLAAVSLTSATQNPIHDVYAALVFASGAKDVLFTMVDGQTIFDGKLTTFDEQELLIEAQRFAKFDGQA